MPSPDGVSVVIPTVGRPSLDPLLDRLHTQIAPIPWEVLVVYDHEHEGPAATRNRGWRAARYGWVAFLDDDVEPAPDWLAVLAGDLNQPEDVAGVQGRIVVPVGERTDWAVNTVRLEHAWWATADMAYRRDVLAEAGGFDERFPRAYREDADLAYRVRRLGYRLVRGRRRVNHPVRKESPWASLRAQRGNADDALLRRIWGPRWHDLLAAPPGRRHRHAGTLALGLAAIGFAATGRRRLAALSALGWASATADFFAVRRRNAPDAPVVPLAVTSALIPPLAIGHWLSAWYRHRHAKPWFAGDLDGVSPPDVEEGRWISWNPRR